MAFDLGPTLAALTAETTIDDSVIAYITGVPALIQAAVDAATANGATAAQLQPVADLATALTAKQNAIVAAIAANTTPAPVSAASLTTALKNA